jgi:hypothetical protein
MIHKRIIDALDGYFSNAFYDEGKLPLEENLNLDDLGVIADDCFLIKIADKLQFSFLGENIIEAYGDDYFSDDVSGIIFLENSEVAKKIRNTIELKKPILDEGVFENSHGIEIKYRQKLYPLASKSNPKKISYIFGGMRWKADI